MYAYDLFDVVEHHNVTLATSQALAPVNKWYMRYWLRMYHRFTWAVLRLLSHMRKVDWALGYMDSCANFRPHTLPWGWEHDSTHWVKGRHILFGIFSIGASDMTKFCHRRKQLVSAIQLIGRFILFEPILVWLLFYTLVQIAEHLIVAQACPTFLANIGSRKTRAAQTTTYLWRTP